MTRMLALCAAFSLGGCGPLTLVSIAVDGISYAETGKSMSGHLIEQLDADTCLIDFMRATQRAECVTHEIETASAEDRAPYDLDTWY